MSMLLMAKAMQLQVGSTAQKMVLLKLADNANDKGECFPSYETIARHCEISRQSAINHIKSLCKKGFVRKVTRKTDKGHTSNLYILDLEAKSLDDGSQNSVPEVVKEFDHGSQTVGLGGSQKFLPRTSQSFNQSINPKKLSSDDSKPAKQISINRQANIPYQEIMQAFNESAGDRLPNAESLNDKRKRAISKFLKELKEPTVESAKNYFDYFMETASAWYFGENNRGWRANFDYLLRPETVLKTREGAL
ncbi:helix-turn-helix domain-containing protein [Proteus mirabilis]|uniref:helix-turn-helix domain-containing protein n=1 Tax=Proteus mirabilis TaxID=584 RepID=UPI0006663151|nr:helix-turn-helix domain-containing protein [Proteus mirabilis]ARX08373.1 replication protein [Proteus mirabilis]AVB29618.1 helix-turn-helix domain-containing protein [Proteus mirabilis]MBS3863690.1 helix-turn-helix domain-containing protein [Proteus mirabilis]MBS3877151.1 helix-turn-helix domain-containing protein [Proteus mirabilis]MCT0237665.1 helix-turn-helix domain-containing protein [Proteus mirabilis]